MLGYRPDCCKISFNPHFQVRLAGALGNPGLERIKSQRAKTTKRTASRRRQQWKRVKTT